MFWVISYKTDMTKPLFRQAALERLSSPDQLDQMGRVTRPRSWLSLLALSLVLLAALVWGFLGRLPVQVTGQGILLSANGLHSIVSPVTGQVVGVDFGVGDVVQAGQIVAHVSESGQADALPVISPYSGRIVERLVDVGSPIEKNAPLLNLEGLNPEGRVDLEAVIYMDPAEGKKIHPGMEVQVSPSTVRREEYGFMLGQVASVGQFPATPQGMLRVLGNSELVKTLAGGGAPIEVRVTLVPDADNPSGYAWSSPSGPPMQVDSGTLCDASITLEQRRPIGLMIPSLK